MSATGLSSAFVSLAARRGGSPFSLPASSVAQLRPQRRSSRLAAKAALADAEDVEETYVPRIDYDLDLITQGKRVGTGSYGLVYEGTLSLPGGKEQDVILKRGKQSINGTRFMRSEAKIARRLKGVKGVAPFLGVAGPDSYLVWKNRGLNTLEDFLLPRNDPLADLYDFWYEPDPEADEWTDRQELDFFKEFAKKLLASASSVHEKGIVHRDIKPSNILVTESAEVLLLDLGAAADLKVGTNFDEDESVLDALYGPPEQYISFQKTNDLFFSITWSKFQPDLFDSYSVGLILLQAAVKFLRTREGLRRMRIFLDQNDSDLDAWRERQSAVAQKEFAILDMDKGAGWEFVKRLVATRKKRISVSKALKDGFLNYNSSKRKKGSNKRN